MHYVATRISTEHHNPVVHPVAGMRARMKSGGEMQLRPGPRGGCSGLRAIPNRTAIAARKASVPSGNGQRCRLRVLANSRQNQAGASANGRRHRLQVAAAASLSPVLKVRTCNRPGHLQAPSVVTGETVRPEHRASAVRPAARATWEYILHRLHQAEGVLLLAELPPGADNLSNGMHVCFKFILIIKGT
jgi:hypothetical protein